MFLSIESLNDEVLSSILHFLPLIFLFFDQFLNTDPIGIRIHHTGFKCDPMCFCSPEAPVPAAPRLEGYQGGQIRHQAHSGTYLAILKTVFKTGSVLGRVPLRSQAPVLSVTNIARSN